MIGKFNKFDRSYQKQSPIKINHFKFHSFHSTKTHPLLSSIISLLNDQNHPWEGYIFRITMNDLFHPPSFIHDFNRHKLPTNGENFCEGEFPTNKRVFC